MTRKLRRALPLANRIFDAGCAFLLLLVVFAASNVARMPEGADDFLFKPFFAKDVDTVLNRLFGLAK